MAGSDPAAGWRAALLAGGHEIAVLAIRDGQVLEANAAARGLFANLRVGMGVDELFDPSCRDKLRGFLREGASGATTELEALQPGRPPMAIRVLLLAAPGEQLLLTGTGGVQYTEEIGAKLMAANAELANMTRELSRRMHQLDAARQATQKLAELRELFIAALAHDLKTPLSIILMSESLLRKKAAPPPAGELEAHAGLVERSATRMLKLIQGLLFTAQVDAADPAAIQSLEPVPLDEIAREAADDLAPLAEEAGVRIEVAAPAPVRVRGNRTWLGQVFTNLLTNAIRHSPPGTGISVTVAAEGPEARAEVADQGPGVPPEERERIFERFVQRGEQRGSIGLGLYVCRRIVELHGGRIGMEDHPGGGARFVFRLPRGEEGLSLGSRRA